MKAFVERKKREGWRAPKMGGLADGKSVRDFDTQALINGIKVEHEHTSKDELALRIAMDHLTEDPQYYEKLKLIEANPAKVLQAHHAIVVVDDKKIPGFYRLVLVDTRNDEILGSIRLELVQGPRKLKHPIFQTHSLVLEGYGPVLYQVAMAHAPTRTFGVWLNIPAATYWPDASDEARHVWDRFQERSDVECSWLDKRWLTCRAPFPKGGQAAIQRGERLRLTQKQIERWESEAARLENPRLKSKATMTINLSDHIALRTWGYGAWRSDDSRYQVGSHRGVYEVVDTETNWRAQSNTVEGVRRKLEEHTGKRVRIGDEWLNPLKNKLLR